jgi:DNA-binding NarL/FixJ family response regulator
LFGKSNSLVREGLNQGNGGGNDMPQFRVSILIAEDFEPFRQFVCAIFWGTPGLEVVFETSDGAEAVQKACALRPDIAVLDIGLPSLNGIEAARRISQLAPATKILFLSQESSAEIVQAAIEAGGHGYVVKTEAEKELLTAIDTILSGERFPGARYLNAPFAWTQSREGSSPSPGFATRARTKVV